MEDHFGVRLREIRERKGMSVNQLGIYSGVSPALISKLENGLRKKPKPITIEKLAKGLKMKYEDLMIIAGYYDEAIRATSLPENNNDLQETINLIEEQAIRLGLSSSDPVFQKMLSDALDLLRIARGKDTK